MWYVPPQTRDEELTPLCIDTFEHPLTRIVEVEADVFLMFSSNLYTTHESFADRLELRDWQPGSPVEPKVLRQFPKQAHGLNGCCLLGPGVILIADCFAGLIRRLDPAAVEGAAGISVWLEHESMGYFPGKMKPEQPGVNGVRYAGKSSFLYYTATAKRLLMRVKVDADTLDPATSPELVASCRMGDDFCLDEDASFV